MRIIARLLFTCAFIQPCTTSKGFVHRTTRAQV